MSAASGPGSETLAAQAAGDAQAATPGQAAREAFGELGADWYPGTPWNGLHEDLRAQWEAAAQAVLNRAFPGLREQLAGMAQENIRLAAELRMFRADLADAEAQLARWPKCPAGCNCRVGIEDDADRNECGCDGPCNGGEQPAPELAAAVTALMRVKGILNGAGLAQDRVSQARAVVSEALEGK